MGCAFSRRLLSTRYLKPSISKTLSLSLGSSRAIPRDGPPHPPSLRKIRMGVTSLPLKYSVICCVADGVTSTIISSLRFECIQSNLFLILVKIVTSTGFVNAETGTLCKCGKALMARTVRRETMETPAAVMFGYRIILC